MTLIITDDDGGSDTDTTVIHVADEREVLQDIKLYVQSLPDSAFKNRKLAGRLRNALVWQLEAVELLFGKGNYNAAIEVLRNDLRTKWDGRVDGDPKNDWITDPQAQETLCQAIDDLVSYLAYLCSPGV